MELNVLPGPSLAELARTALARAGAATISHVSLPAGPAASGPVPVRAGRDGAPLLLPAAASELGRLLAACPEAVTVSVPAAPPFSSLRLTGAARLVARDSAAGLTACAVAVRAVEFTGSGCARIPVEQYLAAAPDPLWRVAPGVLSHLEHGHMGDLVRCVRSHGMTEADWVIPRGLDRYGLELLVLTREGASAVRLSFPDGPVTSLDQVPASIRTVLTCRCQAGPRWRLRPPGGE